MPGPKVHNGETPVHLRLENRDAESFPNARPVRVVDEIDITVFYASVHW